MISSILAVALVAAVFAYIIEFRARRRGQQELARVLLELGAANETLARAREAAQEQLRSTELVRDQAIAKQRELETDLHRARTRLNLDAMKQLFQGAACSRSNFCSELILFKFCTTYEDAAACLQRLETLLKRTDLNDTAAISWAQQTLAPILNSPSPLPLTAPGTEEMVYTKALECYAALTRHLHDASTLRDAIDQTRRCLANHRIRKETTRNLLRSLLNAQPGNRELVDVYDGLLSTTESPLSREARDLIETALYTIPTLSAVDPNDLLQFLQTAFHTATNAWTELSEAYGNTVNRLLGMKRFQKSHLEDLLGQVHGYINGEANSLLMDPARDTEYDTLCKIVVAIHNAQGSDRFFRPKNRHLVQGEPPLEIKMTLVGSRAPTVNGRVKNFAVGGSTTEWRGGAWVLGKQGDGWTLPTHDKDWRRVHIILTHPYIAKHIEMEADVLGPLQEAQPGHFGYRVCWGQPTIENVALLERLGERYPVTR